MQKERLKKVCVGLGLTIFLVVVALLCVYDVLFVNKVFQNLLRVLTPVFTGVVLAYLLVPVVNAVERVVFRRKFGQPVFVPARLTGIIVAWALVFLLLYGLFSMLLPQLIASITQLVDNSKTYYEQVQQWVDQMKTANSELKYFLEEYLGASYNRILEWLTEAVLPRAQELVTLITGGVVAVFSFVYQTLVSFVVSIYLLSTKEHFTASARKLVYSCSKPETAELVLQGARRTNQIFSSYIRGDLLDALLMGILCYIFSAIFRFPYAPLISVVVGVTNLIPFFGPFLGGVPAAFLILLVNPRQCLYFIIFIVALQQFDGNILKPMILGDSTGLNGFWIIVAILAGGAFFGIVGMLLGVPVFACLYTCIHFFASRRLQAKNLPTEIEDYADGTTYGAAPPEKHPVPPAVQKARQRAAAAARKWKHTESVQDRPEEKDREDPS